MLLTTHKMHPMVHAILRDPKTAVQKTADETESLVKQKTVRDKLWMR